MPPNPPSLPAPPVETTTEAKDAAEEVRDVVDAVEVALPAIAEMFVGTEMLNLVQTELKRVSKAVQALAFVFTTVIS